MHPKLPDPATYPHDTYKVRVLDDPLERKWEEASRLSPVFTGLPALTHYNDVIFRKAKSDLTAPSG